MLHESRYDRAERISWWDQERLRNSSVLVVGAGALGNEIVKNLVLVGVGYIHVVDMDEIEHSNLSRCVFFRDGDEGKFKADIVAVRSMELNPEVKVEPSTVKVQQLGSGFLKMFDVVISALDNREARLWLSRTGILTGVPVVDGAIEGLQGIVRVFTPETPCYGCGLTEVDWKQLNHRRSCALLTREDLLAGKTPTNATTSSIVAAIESQEAIKILVGRDDLTALVGKSWHLQGEEMITFTVEMSFDPNCVDHVEIDEWYEGTLSVSSMKSAVTKFTDDAVFILSDDFVYIAGCDTCETSPQSGVISMFSSTSGICPGCDKDLHIDSKTLFTKSEFTECINSNARWPRSSVLQVFDENRTKALVISSDRT